MRFSFTISTKKCSKPSTFWIPPLPPFRLTDSREPLSSAKFNLKTCHFVTLCLSLFTQFIFRISYRNHHHACTLNNLALFPFPFLVFSRKTLTLVKASSSIPQLYPNVGSLTGGNHHLCQLVPLYYSAHQPQVGPSCCPATLLQLPNQLICPLFEMTVSNLLCQPPYQMITLLFTSLKHKKKKKNSNQQRIVISSHYSIYQCFCI